MALTVVKRNRLTNPMPVFPTGRDTAIDGLSIRAYPPAVISGLSSLICLQAECSV